MDREAHPIELALLALLLVAEALAVLVAAVLVLGLSLASCRRSHAAAEWVSNAEHVQHLVGVADTAPAPLPHPLAQLADQLEALPHRQLMQLAGTRRRLAKHRLAELVLTG